MDQYLSMILYTAVMYTMLIHSTIVNTESAIQLKYYWGRWDSVVSFRGLGLWKRKLEKVHLNGPPPHLYESR